MIGIDWVAVVVLGVAWALSNVRTIPLAIRNWIFGLACLGLAGYRISQGAAGLNLIIALVAGGIGLQYVWRAIKAPKA